MLCGLRCRILLTVQLSGLVYLPLVGQPEGQLADGNYGQIDQQLRDVALRIDIMAAAGTGQAGQDGRSFSTARIADEQAVFPIEHNALHLPLANRLAALHSFFQFVTIHEPALALQCQRVLALPSKRFMRGPVEFLTDEETAALVAAPDPRTWIGRRDKALLLVAVQTCLRNSEITSLRRRNVEFGVGAHVRCFGKDRKMRRTQRLVAKHVAAARQHCPSLKTKKVKPHTLRHAAAMALLRGGVDLSIIALWLGHESTETTQIYLHADMQLKEQALAHATPSGLKPDRFRPPGPLLAFLESL